MSVKAIWILVLVLWAASVSWQTYAAPEGERVSDLRVIIDISGSMKKNDPQNLRVPALKLITQLIPEGQQAGVWTFGQYTNMLVKHGEVNRAWKDQAYQAADQISSLGLYTNIEDVLQRSTWDWKRPDEAFNRSIVFLTDGVVDVSKKADENRASRERILNEIVPRLKQAGVQVHTIALSEDADKAFLRQLSSATGGWFETAEDASKLERLFFKMFEKSVPVETLPLTDNTVLVDDSISELTLLIFRDAGADISNLIMPNGERIDHRSNMDNLRWRHEERYDLVTVDNPMPGQWQVDAKLDPDNRVMVVTDLKVRASRLPNMIMVDDLLPYYVELHQNGEVITKPEFLDFVTISLARHADGKMQKSIAMSDDGKENDKQTGDGRFSAAIGGALTAGVYEYEMMLDGITFKRSKRDTVKVVEKPLAVTIKEEKSGDPAQYSVILTPFAELINPDSLLIDAKIAKQGGSERTISIPRAGPTEWRLDMKVKAGDVYRLTLNVQAERLTGQKVAYDLGSFELGSGSVDVAYDQSDEPPADIQPMEMPNLAEAFHKEKQKQEETAVKEEKPALPEEDAVAEEEPVTEEASPEAEAEAEESPSWIWVVAKVVLLNGVLIGVGFVVYRKWFRGPAANEDEDATDAKEADGK